MDTQQIIAELEAQRDRLQEAIAALRGSSRSRRNDRSRSQQSLRPKDAAPSVRMSDLMQPTQQHKKQETRIPDPNRKMIHLVYSSSRASGTERNGALLRTPVTHSGT